MSGCERLIFNGADDIKSNGESAVVLLLLFVFLLNYHVAYKFITILPDLVVALNTQKLNANDSPTSRTHETCHSLARSNCCCSVITTNMWGERFNCTFIQTTRIGYRNSHAHVCRTYSAQIQIVLFTVPRILDC